MGMYTAASSIICQQIYEVICRAPHSVALRVSDKEMSYGDLDKRSAHFAGALTQSGVLPGDTVALCLERSFDWIAAALGVMRAGATYVPLDDGWGDDRLRFAINDSGAVFLVARRGLIGRLALGINALDPAEDAAAVAGAPSPDWVMAPPESLAYIIYTSGSTGTPKGVEITHANLAHLIDWHRDVFSITPQDRVSHVAGLGFDAAVWEVWPTLAAGATLHLPHETARVSPELLREWLVEEQITVSFVPTVLATSMISTAWPMETCLRLFLTGGDFMPRGPVDGLPFAVVNNYGPTECTVVATSGAVRPGVSETPSIGREIARTSVYLLDEQGNEVTAGCVGEMYIGGSGVGRGYRNQADLTKRAFLTDPFAGSPDARMYRTGDLAIRMLNGDLAFRGRADRQAKIRGHRVELDEISTVLGQHPGIDFSTVIITSSDIGEEMLTAYVLPKKQDPVPTVAELQKHLLRWLPSYMIPSAFVRLTALPVSLNGKVDFSRLERPTDANALERSDGRTPETTIERNLLTMVQVLLNSNAVRLEDDFFLVGGHSLVGMQLVLRVRETFGIDLTLRQLFEASTVERLAYVIEAMLIKEVEALTDEEARLQTAE